METAPTGSTRPGSRQMMGQMMGSGGDPWIPVLLGALLVLAMIAAGVAIARTGRAVGHRADDGRGDQAIHAQTRPTGTRDDDQVHALRERYARGEVSHAEFLRDLDAVVRAEQRMEPGAVARPSRAASGSELVEDDVPR